MAPPCVIFRSARRVTICVPITLISIMRRKTASTSSPPSPSGVSRSRPALFDVAKLSERRIDGGWIRDIGDGTPRTNRLGGGKGARIVRDQRQAGARLSESLCHAEADAAAGTRDNHLPAGKPTAHR